jgi:hypothetical protein
MLNVLGLSEAVAFEATLRIFALAIALCSAEYLARPAVLSDGGLSSWPVSRLERRWTTEGRIAAPVSRVVAYPAVVWLVAARLVAAALIVVGAPRSDLQTSALLTIIVGVTIALVIRCQYGHDGADQMNLIGMVVCLIATLTGAREPVLWFVAGQSVLAYATAGLSKLSSPIWRDGSALPGVFRTRLYGNAVVYRLIFDRPYVARVVCWVLISFECAFPIVLIGIPSVSTVLVALGVCFHGINALVMRLNTFFWSFVATYPAVLYCAGQVYDAWSN